MIDFVLKETMLELHYKEQMFITYKGDTYLILQIVHLENYCALLCQKDSSNKVETIELPIPQDQMT